MPEWNRIVCSIRNSAPAEFGSCKAVRSFQEFVVSPEGQRLVLPRPGQVAQNYASLEKDGLGAGQVEESGLDKVETNE